VLAVRVPGTCSSILAFDHSAKDILNLIISAYVRDATCLRIIDRLMCRKKVENCLFWACKRLMSDQHQNRVRSFFDNRLFKPEFVHCVKRCIQTFTDILVRVTSQ